jgi:hypothetical protein
MSTPFLFVPKNKDEDAENKGQNSFDLIVVKHNIKLIGSGGMPVYKIQFGEVRGKSRGAFAPCKRVDSDEEKQACRQWLKPQRQKVRAPPSQLLRRGFGLKSVSAYPFISQNERGVNTFLCDSPFQFYSL